MATRFLSIPVLMVVGEVSDSDRLATMIKNVHASAAESGQELDHLLSAGYEIVDRESFFHSDGGVLQGLRVLILFKPDPLPVRKPGPPTPLENAAINVEAFMRD